MELSNILNYLKRHGYAIDVAEANEVDPAFVEQATKRLEADGHNVTIHQADWNHLDEAEPPYGRQFDFGFLVGSSLTYVGGDTREENKTAQAAVLKNFAQRIEKDGYLLLDTRDYDYIASIADLPVDELKKAFTFEPNIYYQGAQKEVTILPVYVDETRICFHYYDVAGKKWSLLELYRVYPEDVKKSLGEDFEVTQVYRDFEPENETNKGKAAFIQYLAKKK